MSSLVLAELNVYPVKSCKGISLQSAYLEARGLRHDRRWMVVDEHDRFITQREMPRLALVSPALEADHLVLTAPRMPELKVPFRMTSANVRPVTVWDDVVSAADVGDEARSWFSSFLGIPAGLVHMPDTADRPVSMKGHASQVSFADATPLLLISESSLVDLNSRLAEPLPMNRFRPNLVVRGCEPYAEDSWMEMVLGNVRLHAAELCTRCVTTTVNQLTGEKGREPLRTLATYREHDGGVIFGHRLIHVGPGLLKVGDEARIVG